MLKLDKETKKYTFAPLDCHHSLNQYGEFALKTKEAPYRNIYHSQILSNPVTERKNSKEQEETLSKLLLHQTQRRSSAKVNPELEEQIRALKEMGLDRPRQLKRVAYEGQIKIPTVHNDYHSRASNHGYSRSPSGGIYPK